MKASGMAMVPTLMALNGVKERLGKGIYTPTVEAKGREAVAQAGKALKLPEAAGWATQLRERFAAAAQRGEGVQHGGRQRRRAPSRAWARAPRLAV